METQKLKKQQNKQKKPKNKKNLNNKYKNQKNPPKFHTKFETKITHKIFIP